MRRNLHYQRNHIELMPIYNRTGGQSKLSSDGSITLSTHKKIVYLEKEVKSDDTLQSIALEFNVPVSELKRINNIHKDNEIFARKILKVPSNPLSLLLEKEYFTKESGSSSDNTSAAAVCATTNIVNSYSVNPNYDVIVEAVNNSNCNTLNTCDDENDVLDGRVGMDGKAVVVEEESISLLSSTPDNKKEENDVMSCNGADWGISWHALILFTLLIGVGGPVLYVFWFLWGKSHKDDGS